MAKLNITNKLASPVKLKDINIGDVFYYPSKYETLKGYYIKTNRNPSVVDDNNKLLECSFTSCTRLSDGVHFAIDDDAEILNNFKVNINIDYNIM